MWPEAWGEKGSFSSPVTSSPNPEGVRPPPLEWSSLGTGSIHLLCILTRIRYYCFNKCMSFCFLYFPNDSYSEYISILLESIYIFWSVLFKSFAYFKIALFYWVLRVLDTNSVFFQACTFKDLLALLVKIETKHLLNAEGRAYHHDLGVALMDS